MVKKNAYIEILGLTNGLVILFLLSKQKEFLYVSVAIALLAIFIPSFATLVGRGLRKVLQLLGDLTNQIILGAVYIGVLTPIALLYRLFRSKKRHYSRNSGSFFNERNHTYIPEDFNRQW